MLNCVALKKCVSEPIMIELATAIKVVSLVNSSFDLLDNVVSYWKKYVKQNQALLPVIQKK